MNLEWYFLIYAFPAMESCGKLDESERDKLEQMVLEGKAPSKERLEEIVPDAFRRMEEKIGSDYWTEEGIKKYWWVEHNKIIDNKEEGYKNTTHEHNEVCKVKFWEVLEIKDNKAILINNQGKVEAFNYRNLDLNGEKYVTTHKGHIIQEITKKEYQEYG